MILIKKNFLFLAIILITSCTEPGQYQSFNPPSNGVVIEGSSNMNLSGFKLATLDICKDNCYLTASNNVFFGVSGFFEEELNNEDTYVFNIQIDSLTEVSYLYYKDKNGDLARDTRTYPNGILPTSMANNPPLLYIYNGKQMITERGVIYMKSNYFQFYFQLKEPIKETLKFCYGALEKEKTIATLQTTKNMLCFNELA